MNCQGCGQTEALEGYTACGLCRQLAKARLTGVRIRVFGRLRVVTETGCWEYEGGKTDAGYAGLVMVEGKQVHAYRWALLDTEPKPGPGFEADHVCFNRACCRPSHLRWLPMGENRQRRQNPSTPEKRRAQNRARVARFKERYPERWRSIRQKSDRKRRARV